MGYGRRELLGEGFAFGVVGYGEVDDGGGFALGGFHDGCAVGVGYIDDLVAELLEGVADGDCAGGTVRFYHAGVEDVEAGYDEGGAGVVEDELRCAVAEVGGDVGAQVGDAPAVVVEDDVFDGHVHFTSQDLSLLQYRKFWVAEQYWVLRLNAVQLIQDCAQFLTQEGSHIFNERIRLLTVWLAFSMLR